MNNDAKASVIQTYTILQNNSDFRSKHQTLGAKVTLGAKPR
jgi:hypothetical protein